MPPVKPGSYTGTSVKRLVVRRGDDGAVLRHRDLTGDPAASECPMGAFKVASRATPVPTWRATMAAPGNTPPELSCTRPTILPLLTWADARAAELVKCAIDPSHFYWQGRSDQQNPVAGHGARAASSARRSRPG